MLRRVQAIVRKVLKELMLTKVNLARKGGLQQASGLGCPFCNEEDETQGHLFFSCEFSAKIYMSLYMWLNIEMVPHTSPIVHHLQHSDPFGYRKKTKMVTSLWVGTIWSISNARNDLIFNSIESDNSNIVE